MNNVNKLRMLDRSSPIPLHYQLRQIIRDEVLNGDLVLDEKGKIPTEGMLAERFKVSRITVKNAIRNLVEEGLLHRVRGKGTFIKKTNEVEKWVGRLLGFSEMISASGFKPSAKLIYQGLNHNLPELVKKNLKMEHGWEYKRIRYADDIPIAIEHSYYPPSIGKDLTNLEDLDSIFSYRFLEEKFGITLYDGEQSISAVNASKEEAETLEITEGGSLLYMERVTYSAQKKPIVYCKAVFNPKYFQYVVYLQR